MSTTRGTLLAANAGPVCAASDGTLFWYTRNDAGVWEAWAGSSLATGARLGPAYGGHRGPSDVTPDGRYVLLTTAVTPAWLTDDKSGPGRGQGTSLQLYDRQTQTLSTLLASVYEEQPSSSLVDALNQLKSEAALIEAGQPWKKAPGAWATKSGTESVATGWKGNLLARSSIFNEAAGEKTNPVVSCVVSAEIGTLMGMTYCVQPAATFSGYTAYLAKTGTNKYTAFIKKVKEDGNETTIGEEQEVTVEPGDRISVSLSSAGHTMWRTPAAGGAAQELCRGENAEWNKGFCGLMSFGSTGSLNSFQIGEAKGVCQKGVIWPRFNAAGTKISWTQIIGNVTFPALRWKLCVADVNKAAGTISNLKEWQDPNGLAAFYECYGWLPNSSTLVFASTTRKSETGGWQQLYTLPDTLDAATPPTRISPPNGPTWYYHEFAWFIPGQPKRLFASIGGREMTFAGIDLWEYDLTGWAGGLMPQPTRVSWLNGPQIANWPPAGKWELSTAAWVVDAWIVTASPQVLSTDVSAFRVGFDGTVAVSVKYRISDRFPVGTSVSAYPATSRVHGGKPAAASIATNTVDAAGVLTLSLPSGTPVQLYAEVGAGNHVYVRGGDPTSDLPLPTLRQRLERRQTLSGASFGLGA